jgi:peptide/nickel transport system ATP-binding protein
LTQETGLDQKQIPEEKELLLSVEDLKISFVTRGGVIHAIEGVSFQINHGETLGLVGETGCGKSQTAFAIMRLTPPRGLIEHGKIVFNGKDLTKNIAIEMRIVFRRGYAKLKRNNSALKKMNAEMSKVRGNDISIIFQEPMTSLNPVYKISRQISEVLIRHSLDVLVDRILARNSVSKEQLGIIAEKFFQSSHTKEQLHIILQQENLVPLEDQIWHILDRPDIGQQQKIDEITRLADNRMGESTLRFLRAVKNANGNVPVSYRIQSRLPAIRNRYLGVIEKEAITVSFELLSSVRMPNALSVLNQYPHELSGGMRQRVMIAMAIAAKPKLVIADEPTSALDVTVQAQILELLRQLKASSDTSILFISHDMGIIAEICDRVGVMYAGNLVEIGDLQEIFENPKHPYTQGLLTTIPKYGEKRDTLQTIPGSVPNLIYPPKGCRFVARCKFAFEKCNEKPLWFEDPKTGHGVLCWLYEKNDLRNN